MQHILKGHEQIEQALRAVASHRYMLVCDASFPFLPIKESLHPAVVFDQFTPNPLYEQVCNGVKLFNDNRCDALVAVGGGSTIDVAKCIKLYCKMDPHVNYLQQDCFDSRVPLIAVPTTAGTGSESTRYAVVYFEGKKQSVTHESIVPDYVVLEPMLLKTLPLYQKKCTLMDALCQGIESWWSVNSNDESKQYSKIAVETIMAHWKDYIFHHDDGSNAAIMEAANYAGRAINITQTTAPHAMSYKLTSMFGLPHGHAVAVCLPEVWHYMLEHPEECIDPRGSAYLFGVFDDISSALGFARVGEAVASIRSMIDMLELQYPQSKQLQDDIDILTQSVNPVRLKNNPVALTPQSIRQMYCAIVQK